MSRFIKDCDDYYDLLIDENKLEHEALVIEDYMSRRSIVPVALYKDLVLFNVFHGTKNIHPQGDRQYAFAIPFQGKDSLFEMYLSGRKTWKLPKWSTKYCYSANPKRYPNHLMFYNIIYHGVSDFDIEGNNEKQKFLLKLTWKDFTDLVKLGKRAVERNL